MKHRPAPLGVADWLALAAAPTFALMAVLTALAGGGHVAALCSQAGLTSPLVGMMPMYALMTVFHLAPWFRGDAMPHDRR